MLRFAGPSAWPGGYLCRGKASLPFLIRPRISENFFDTSDGNRWQNVSSCFQYNFLQIFFLVASVAPRQETEETSLCLCIRNQRTRRRHRSSRK